MHEQRSRSNLQPHIVIESSALPVERFLPAIARLVAEKRVSVLSAAPGAGKTSLVPLHLASVIEGRILVVEPRRIAAVAAAARMAELSGTSLGDGVGYRVRGDSRAGGQTRITAITGGVFVRMAQADPGLAGVDMVIFDEFHERSLEADLGLALALEIRSLRDDFSILLMSATIDEEGLSERLGAGCLAIPGASHPVETRHAKSSPADLEAFVAGACLDLLFETGGDILAFLPGVAEIARTREALLARRAAKGRLDFEVLPLHGSLPLDEQRRIIAPLDAATAPRVPPRIILATSIAETSLTVPRIRAVVDSGLARGQRHDARSGLNRLVTERESLDRADQRRGRAGRLGPGICLRAWPASESLPERSPPEIRRAELSGLVLESFLWGARNRLDLPWLDEPPEAGWEAALNLLCGLGALAANSGVRGTPANTTSATSPAAANDTTAANDAVAKKTAEANSTAADHEAAANITSEPLALTPRGRSIARLGIEPRLGALIIAGREVSEPLHAAAWEACLAAALLSEGLPFAAHSSGEEIDFAQRVENLGAGRRAAESGGRRTLEEAQRLAKAAGIDPRGPVRTKGLGALFASAWPDRIAARGENRGATATFALYGGRLLDARLVLAASPWIVVLDADAGASKGRVYSGIAISEEEALAALAPLMVESLEIEWRGRGYRARREMRAGSLLLSRTALGALPQGRVGAALASRLLLEGFACLQPDAAVTAWLARLRWWIERRGGEGLPSFAEAELASGAGEWLLPFVVPDTADVLPGRSLLYALEGRLSRSQRETFEREAPTQIRLPSGRSRPISYEAGLSPLVESRVQDFYGVSVHPTAAGVPLVIRLLSPAGRPVQVTSDLPGYWKGAWAETRKDLRGRYPKHDWPINPASPD